MGKVQKSPATTTMVIDEIVTIEKGDQAGDLVINVLATRNGNEHRLPYHINRRKIVEVDIEFLKQRVIHDLDALEAEQNKHNAVIDKLKLQQGKTIDLG